ncbi:hypothetical protein ACI2OX_11775 [Bacillus sp. N9]
MYEILSSTNRRKRYFNVNSSTSFIIRIILIRRGKLEKRREDKNAKEKHLITFMSTILSLGLLIGCNGVDEDEPDPSEEPSEQMEDQSQ